MRIAIITPVYPPYSAGISRMAEEEVKILEEAGFEVTVFTPAYTKIHSTNKVKYIRPVLKYGNAAFIPQLLWKLRGFDAVHLHYPFLGGASAALLWKKLFGRKIPLVVTYHMDLRGKGIFRIIFYIFTRIMTPIILKSASKIIVTTLDYAQSSVFYETLRGEQLAAKLVEVPPSVDVHKFQPNKKEESLLKQFNINHDDKVALFVGALDKAHYFKGIPTLLAAFELLYKRYHIRNAKLLIVGGGNLKGFYQNLVRKSEIINDKVIFTGKVPDHDLPKFYNLADFLVLPSIDSSEAFGIVLLEAFASGKPVIASNLPGVRAVVEVEKSARSVPFGTNGSRTGLLAEPGNFNALADNLKKLFEEPHLHEWGRYARFLAETKYSRDIVGRKLINIFKSYEI